MYTPAALTMNSYLGAKTWRVGALVAGAILGAATAVAFPPAPHHTLFGMVRNQWGDPISLLPGVVILETPSGTLLQVGLAQELQPGVNYRLKVPMDSGATDDLYNPTALRPFFQFRLKVQIGRTTYLPIEMAGDFSQIGEPGGETRIDLTLGEDSDGDGLPDAWEQRQFASQGGTLDTIRPNDDLDGDGISNLNEYLAGTYTFDPSDGFSLVLVGANPDYSTMELLTITGRTYSIMASKDLDTWTPVQFRITSQGASATLQDNYLATDVRTLRVEVPSSPELANRYFKALVH